MNAVLTAADMYVRYGGNRAVVGASVTVGAGTLVAVAGGNGAGKSTLVNAIAGWSRGKPTVSGAVHLDGEDISALPAHRRMGRGLVLVPEGLGAFGQMTVRENLEFARPPKTNTRRTFSIDELFAIFPNLVEREHQRTGRLSGGERQMVAVARALRAAPRLLILDEPSVGLAPRIVEDLLRSIRRLVDEVGLSVLLVEQNVRASLAVADELYLLERGGVVTHGPAETMRDDPRISAVYLGGHA